MAGVGVKLQPAESGNHGGATQTVRSPEDLKRRSTVKRVLAYGKQCLCKSHGCIRLSPGNQPAEHPRLLPYVARSVREFERIIGTFRGYKADREQLSRRARGRRGCQVEGLWERPGLVASGALVKQLVAVSIRNSLPPLVSDPVHSTSTRHFASQEAVSFKFVEIVRGCLSGDIIGGSDLRRQHNRVGTQDEPEENLIKIRFFLRARFRHLANPCSVTTKEGVVCIPLRTHNVYRTPKVIWYRLNTLLHGPRTRRFASLWDGDRLPTKSGARGWNTDASWGR